MAAVEIETCYLKDILSTLPELPPHNWRISGLECYDDCGWDGCEKWAESDLFLTDEELKHDIDLRNMQIIWGVFSAIPVVYSWEEVDSYPLPEAQTSYYMSSRIAPRHPQAILELAVNDGMFTIVSAHDPALLQPLYELPYKIVDLETENQRLNALLRRIQDTLRTIVPDVTPEIANAVQWNVYHSLFHGKDRVVHDKKLRFAVMWEYEKQRQPGAKRRCTFWDPYSQA